MRFEHPAALALILFAVLLLFVTRRNVRARRTVGNLYLWREASSTDAAALTRRLRRHWLLILQALFLCAVAAAIAGPRVELDAPVTLILDTSASMAARHGEGTRMETARARARSVLEAMPGHTRVRVLAAGPSPRLIGEFEANSPAAAAAIESVTVTDAGADLTAAIEHASGAHRRLARTYVFSDADASQLAAASASAVEWVPIGQPVDNVAIMHLGARALDRSSGMQLLVRLANHGAVAATGVLILTHGDAEVARQPVAISARSGASHSFSLPMFPGVVTARLDHADALTSDNVRRLVVAGERRIRVHLPTARSVFLQQALSAHPNVLLNTPAASAADVMVCDGCTDLPPRSGGEAANILLVPPRPSPPGTPVPLVKVTADHALADALELDGVDAVVMVGGAVPAGGRVIVQASGTPAVIAYEQDSRRVVELRLDPDSGTFPFSPALPILVSNALRWLIGRDAPPLGVTAGEPLQWHLGVRGTAPSVVGPDGASIHSTWSNDILSIADTHLAGLYTIRLDGRDVAVAVNPAVESESDLLLPSSPPAPGRADAAAGGSTAERNLSTALIIGALCLLAFEWRGRVTRAPGT